MSFFLLCLLMVVYVIRRNRTASNGSDEQGPDTDRRPTSADRTPPPRRQPGMWVRQLQQQSMGLPQRNSAIGGAVPRGLTDPDTAVWTALDDHQLTRLLKESSS
jgi:hypothetical protein